MEGKSDSKDETKKINSTIILLINLRVNFKLKVDIFD